MSHMGSHGVLNTTKSENPRDKIFHKSVVGKRNCPYWRCHVDFVETANRKVPLRACLRPSDGLLIPPGSLSTVSGGPRGRGDIMGDNGRGICRCSGGAVCLVGWKCYMPCATINCPLQGIIMTNLIIIEICTKPRKGLHDRKAI